MADDPGGEDGRATGALCSKGSGKLSQRAMEEVYSNGTVLNERSPSILGVYRLTSIKDGTRSLYSSRSLCVSVQRGPVLN